MRSFARRSTAVAAARVPPGHRVLDDLQLRAVLLSRFGSVRSGMALVDVRHLQGASDYQLHPLGERGDLFAVGPGWPASGSAPADSPACQPRYEPSSLSPLGFIVSARAPLSGVQCSMRLSKQIAVGWPLPPTRVEGNAHPLPTTQSSLLESSAPSADTPPTTEVDRVVENATGHRFALHSAPR